MSALFLAEVVVEVQRNSDKELKNPQTIKYSGCDSDVYSF